ncbi:LOW QUALITY PROTEIN: reverse transcriptase [Phytophthora megakarya]|uniref:Reverse transcriptase n=1 Tax=Phytophthora megakarya TaxID=4795 RepID=A0A225VXQ5_9STRA|nr:LOW QUALITY PROTEIN: reverse transcriptase [Phytophthora megakarya]
MCDKVENLLDVCDRWNLSISVATSYWGRRKVTYLGHQLSTEGLEAKPKDLEAFSNLPFPTELKSMQSLLGSLNYYSRFIEDFAVYASIMYELREVDYYQIARLKSTGEPEEGTTPADEERNRWTRAMSAFTILKAKIISTPILKNFDPGRTPIIVLYANKWAISAATNEGTRRLTLKANEMNYCDHKEVLAFLRMLDVCYSQLVTRSIKVLSRFSTLAWLLKSNELDGRLGRWAALLSGEEETLGEIAASITPRAEGDEALIAIAPKKQPRKMIATIPPTVELEESLLVASFDGSARVKRAGGAFSAILWKLPEWTILEAITGDCCCVSISSRLKPGGEMRGEIDCKATGLQLLRQKALNQLRSWPKHEFVHVKRDWNQSAYKFASVALQREEGEIVTAEGERQGLITLNRLHEILQPRSARSVTRVNAVSRSAVNRTSPPAAMDESIVRRIRSQRIKQAQDEEKWIAGLKEYLNGDLNGLSKEDAKTCSKIAATYEVDEDGLLFYCPRTLTRDEDRDDTVRLVVSESLQQDFLHHYHTSLEGGHQGVGRHTVESGRVFTGVICTEVSSATEKEPHKSRKIAGEYARYVPVPGHIHGSRPVATEVFKGDTELLIWADLFTGYVIAKAGPSRGTQVVAETYEECVFRRFGACETFRHDREPGFMADFFRAFNRIVKMRQSPTMAYRPQGNGKADRTVQTLTRALKMYISDVNQQDWDDYAERLTFALNTAQDRVRGDTSFYLVHGWDARSTLEATLPIGSTRRKDSDARRWRYRLQSQYRRAREVKPELPNYRVRPDKIEQGSQVWLYLDRVKEGFARKLAHMWHGPFRVTELIGDHAARVETSGTEYRTFPVVHLSKLKLVRAFPDRPTCTLLVEEGDRVDFDESLLPEANWETPLGEDEFEVERITEDAARDMAAYTESSKCFGKAITNPLDEADPNCRALLAEFERTQTNRRRFNVMQAHEEASDNL